ncbi:hypothetical protein [Xylanimonas ulmi]|uniref:PAP2 superfamily protein n=1 Tax=Xylanimonas ulmi TaxID=228973 RepID=A0A4Q7M6X8_9MICO|nr:hypothetical protein [Xylanibacterium ulmi]RZS61849.1 hypothetical protein EV386_2161 [Xylanibacterium ulmi]
MSESVDVRGRRAGRPRRHVRDAAGPAAVLVGALIALSVVGAVLAGPAAHPWDSLASANLIHRDGLWRVMRGGVKWLTHPALGVAALLAAAHLVRGGRRRSAMVGLCAGGAGLVLAEAFKHGVIPFPDLLGQVPQRPVLSGHAAMVVAVAPVVLTALRRRRWATVLAVAVAAGVAASVVVAQWHLVSQGVLAQLTVAACVAVAAAVVRGGRPVDTFAVALGLVSLGLLAWAVGGVVLLDVTRPDAPQWAMALAGSALLAGAVAAAAASLDLATALDAVDAMADGADARPRPNPGQDD